MRGSRGLFIEKDTAKTPAPAGEAASPAGAGMLCLISTVSCKTFHGGNAFGLIEHDHRKTHSDTHSLTRWAVHRRF